jgi:threonine synthase
MWRYAAVGAVAFRDRISLGEGWTPLLEVDSGTYIKDESVNPTGSFKDRGMSMAVSVASILRAGRLVAPSAGNAAVALAAYGREAGLDVLVSMPDDTPPAIVDRCRDYGADVHLVDGDISIAGKWLDGNRQAGDFDVSTLKEPYRVEGKKTMGYELWEQFQGALPDVVVYPTGGGTGLVGMWKAFDEMQQNGWLDGHRPKLVCVQSAGCAPIVEAYKEGHDDVHPWTNPETTAWGLRVPSPIGGFLCLRAVRETGGTAIAIEEARIHDSTYVAADRTGIDFCPEGGAAWAAMEVLRESGFISPEETVLVWNTGSGKSYDESFDGL